MKNIPRALFYTLYPIPFLLLGLLFTPLAYAASCAPNNITTAFGPFDTCPGGFVSMLFRIILSIASIAALILIVLGGFQLGFSQGNQEKVQAAKEIITSAVIGLIFVIFSTTILQIIGVNVLGLGAIFGK